MITENTTYDPLSIDRIIEFLERTDEGKWCTDVVKTTDGKSCIKGHIFDMGGNFFMDMFEERYATDYMIYPINDGTNPNYSQETPKQRVLTYLKNMREGKERTTEQIMEQFDEERRKTIL